MNVLPFPSVYAQSHICSRLDLERYAMNYVTVISEHTNKKRNTLRMLCSSSWPQHKLHKFFANDKIMVFFGRHQIFRRVCVEELSVRPGGFLTFLVVDVFVSYSVYSVSL